MNGNLAKCTVIGHGLIGAPLCDRINQTPGWGVERVITRTKEKHPLSRLEDIVPNGTTIAFLAIPTYDGGEEAYGYIRHFVEQDIPIVTCEKGALSHHYDKLRRHLHLIGHNATVGGGTRMIEHLKGRQLNRENVIVWAVINGSLNYIFEEIGKGEAALGGAIEEAKRLRSIEPNAYDPLAILNGEIKDTAMKVSVLFNTCFSAGEALNMPQLKVEYLDEASLSRLVREAANRRYVVSFSRSEEDGNDKLAGFTHKIGGWFISAGFKRIDSNPLFPKWLPRGLDNSVLISEGVLGAEGVYTLTGPGAGPKPTVASMILDAQQMLLSKAA